MGKKIDTSKYEDHVILGPVIRYLKSNLGILLAFLILCIVLSIAADNFLTVLAFVCFTLPDLPTLLSRL